MNTVAIVGATGAVGQEFRRVLEQRNFPAASYRLFASPRSAGKSVDWIGGPLPLEALTADSFKGVSIAFFSAGAAISREYAPLAVRSGAVVIDNSSAFRMDPQVPLVVPEINGDLVSKRPGILAVPNCTAIILCMAIAPLHRALPLRRVVVSTYQAISGAGARALAEFEMQSHMVLHGQPAVPEVLPEPCAFNVFSHNTAIESNGYNGEENKVIAETRKILGAPELPIAPTCMRVSVRRAHTESVSLEFSAPVSPEQAREILSAAPGVRLLDDRANNRFPTALKASDGDDVLVGRLRSDPSVPNGCGLQLICAGDQLRKGAALNAVQMGERVLQ